MAQFLEIYPVLSCNGVGQNFWPVSRKEAPKQFSKIGKNPSLFQDQVKKLNGCGFRNPTVVSPISHRYILAEQLNDIGQDMHLFIAEPEPSNSAAAFCAAAEVIAQRDPNAILLLPMSEAIDVNEDILISAVQTALSLLRDGHLVLLGAKPTEGVQRHTFVELAQGTASSTSPQPFAQVLHHPDPSAINKMLETNRYMWSADIALVSVKTLRALYGRSAAPIRATVRRAVRECVEAENMVQLGEAYTAVDDLNFENAILEHHNGFVVPVPKVHSSIGNWYDLWSSSNRDARGVQTTGNAMAINCDDTLLCSENFGTQIVGLGLSNVAVVATEDAVLVADLDHLDALPVAVKTMQRQDIPQAFAGRLKVTPWGSIETLQSGARHKVRSMTIKAGHNTQTLSHLNRTENWVVVEGTGRIVIDGYSTLLRQNETLTIPTGRDYRIENPGKAPLTLIEVITGPYLGDDDITVIETGLPAKESAQG